MNLKTIFLEIGDEQFFGLQEERTSIDGELKSAFDVLYENNKKQPFNRINWLNSSLRDLVKELFPDECVVRVTALNMRKKYGSSDNDLGEIYFYYELDVKIN